MDERAKVFELFNEIEEAVNRGGQIAELLAESQHRDEFERFDQLMDKLAQLDRELDMDRKAADETHRQDNDEDSDKRILAKHYKQIRKNFEAADAGRHQKDIGAIRQRIEQEKAAGGGEGQAEEENGEEDDDDEDMEMIEDVISDKDPITKRPIRDPVKNTICQHIYDRDSVQQYIEECRQRRQLCQCPIRLCNNKKQLQMAQMVPFPEFHRLVKRPRRSRSRSRGPGPSNSRD